MTRHQSWSSDNLRTCVVPPPSDDNQRLWAGGSMLAWFRTKARWRPSGDTADAATRGSPSSAREQAPAKLRPATERTDNPDAATKRFAVWLIMGLLSRV